MASRSVFSENPAKRVLERVWLGYTPVWGAVVGLVMAGGFADRWGDFELMILGVSLALAALFLPLYFARDLERGLPFGARTSVKMGLSVLGFSFLLNYFQTPFFFDVLHMHYGFNTQLNVRNVPVFLYPLTIPYFATYCVLLAVVHRVLRGLVILAPFIVAALETLLNANPFTTRLFCYDDTLLVLTFGTFCYGTDFLFMGPVWRRVDERAGQRTPLGQVLVWVLAATMAIMICLEVYRYGLAPLLTEVEPGAQNLRDFKDSCLLPPLSRSEPQSP